MKKIAVLLVPLMLSACAVHNRAMPMSDHMVFAPEYEPALRVAQEQYDRDGDFVKHLKARRAIRERQRAELSPEREALIEDAERGTYRKSTFQWSD